MHAWRRYGCNLVIALIGAKGAAIFWASMGFQVLRLHRLLAHGLAMQDPGCPMAFCDYSVFWLAGRLGSTQGPEVMYDTAKFYPAAMQMLPHQIANLPFMYPPTMLPLIYVISRPPLAAGYYAFTITAAAAAVMLLRRAQIPWLCIAAGLLSPAGLWGLYLGQFSILCTGMFIAGLAALETRPGGAGALLAALCIKPQYAMLAPAVILARRNATVLRGATLTGLALLALTLAGFGWGAWAAFLGPGRDAIRALLQMPFNESPARSGISVFWMARSLGAGLAGAYVAQAAASALASFCAWRLWQREDLPRNGKIAITLCLALLATPYGYIVDMTGFCAACAMLMRRKTPLANAMLAVLWVSPSYIGHFAEKFGFLPTPLCIIAVASIGWWQLRRDFAPASWIRAGRRSAPVLSLGQNLFHRFR